MVGRKGICKDLVMTTELLEEAGVGKSYLAAAAVAEEIS